MVIGAIGFSSVAQKNWQTILNKISMDSILNLPGEELYYTLLCVKGIGAGIANTIVAEREALREDLVVISKLPNIISSYNRVEENKPQVRFTGIRDTQLEQVFNSIGFDADGKKGVTKKTVILIIPHEGFHSNKMNQIDPNVCMILTPEGAWRMLEEQYGIIVPMGL